jgi:3-oxoacyl-[acyl-carrier protein] reductase
MVKACGGEASLYHADIRDAGQVQAMVRDFVACWGRLDVVICNAGLAISGLLFRLSPEQWTAVIETNLTGTFHCLRAAGSVMLSQKDGSVVVVTSFAGLQGQTGQTAYAASKAGLLGLVKTAAKEWGQHNIRINAVCPGWHQTELSGASLTQEAERTDHVLGRFVELESVARSVYHLALSRGTSGQVWNLDSRIL